MQISSRLTIATHIMMCIDTFKNEYKLTSEFLASSVNVNPVIIRNILSQLKAANLVEVSRGVGGARIIKELNEISLFDLYKAVECVEHGNLFHFHESPNPNCPVGKNIHMALNDSLNNAQKALEEELKSVTLEDVRMKLRQG